jgi:type IV secretion system protein VirB10
VSALERRLSGNAFARNSATTDEGDTPAMPRDGTTGAALPLTSPVSIASVSGAGVVLPRAAFGDTASAGVLRTQRLLLPKGAFIDCTLETAIDSTLPGMTTCVTATDTFGVDGRVVLLERGTKLVGETRGQLQQGTARVFILWTEARTPTGVIVPLDSPGTDELGRSGLSGSVDRHFWQRFGAALLVSAVDGAVQAAVQSSSRGGGAIIYNPSAAQDVTTEVLKSTVSIPPTVRKENGDRIQVLVARDIDFTSVYELRHAARQP